MLPRLHKSFWDTSDNSFPFSNTLQQLAQELSGDWFSSDSPSFPPVNVWEKDDVLHLETPLAGYRPEDISVSIEGDQLVLEGRVTEDKEKEEEGTVHRRERFMKSFRRSVRLPFAVNEGEVRAQLKNGLLTLELPKAEEARRRQIAIESAE